MHFFHHKDEIGPFQQLGRDRIVGIITEFSGCAFNARVSRENLLCSRAAQAVLAADKKDAFQLCQRLILRVPRAGLSVFVIG